MYYIQFNNYWGKSNYNIKEVGGSIRQSLVITNFRLYLIK